MDIDGIITMVEAEENLPGEMPDSTFEDLCSETTGMTKKEAYTFISRIAVDATKNCIIEKLHAMKAEQESRTVSSSDPCEPPERRPKFMSSETEFNTKYQVPVLLVDGPCDYQEFFVDEDAESFVATSGEDGCTERQLYVWELDDNGEKKYHNDTKNPGKGIYWMRWQECLGW